MQAHDADTSAATDCTDYSGLGEAVPEKDRGLSNILAEVNQRHEWAMEVQICPRLCVNFNLYYDLVFKLLVDAQGDDRAAC